MDTPSQTPQEIAEQIEPAKFDFQTFYTSIGPSAIAWASNFNVPDPEGTWHNVAIRVGTKAEAGKIEYKNSMEAALRSYTITAIRRATQDERKAKSRRPNEILTEPSLIPEQRAGEDVEENVGLSLLMEAAKASPKITESHLEILKLIHIEDLTLAEAGKKLGITRTGAMGRLNTAHKYLANDPNFIALAAEFGYGNTESD